MCFLDRMMANRNGKMQGEVLVVDDHDAVRELLVEALGVHEEIAGAFGAKDVSAARRLLRERGARIELILLDHFMPGVRGLDFAGELAAEEGEPVAVIMITGSLLDGMEAAFLGCGSERLLPIAVLRKPILLNQLFPLVAEGLARVRAARRRN